MAWPKGKPRKKKDQENMPKDKFICDCGRRMVEENYRDYMPGQALFVCYQCQNKRIINF